MKTILLLIISLLASQMEAISQSKLGNEWITGGGGQRIKFTMSGIATKNTIFYNTYFHKGNSNICDTNGHLILCSDGYNIYDSNANYINGGDTLVDKNLYIHYNGWSLYSQTSIFLPMDSNKYYFITPCYSTGNLCFSCPFDVLLYNVIDMNANSGAGKVVKRMQPIVQNAKLSRTQMMACRHSNGKDWWLLKQGSDSNIVYIFLISQDSIYDKGKQVFNAPIWGLNDLQGQSVFTKDGNQYATTRQSDGFNGDIFIADFDRCYGTLSNPKVIQMPIGSQHDPTDTTITERSPYGLAYSPNGKLLYAISMSNIWQYDLQDTTWYYVAGLDTSYLYFEDYNASYLGPDDKLYIGNYSGTSKQMSVINNPDVKGAGCNFCPRCLRLDSLVNGYVSTPPCMPNYALGAQVCWPESASEIKDKSGELIIYPNPSSSYITISYQIRNGDVGKLIIYDMLGRKRMQVDLQSNANKVVVSTSILEQGIYTYKYIVNNIQEVTGKLILE